MANTEYSALLPEVLTELAADPSNPVAINAIKRAVIDFCAGSWIWKYLADPISVQVGNAVYDLEAPDGADITTVNAVSFAGVPLVPKTTDWLDENLPDWRTDRKTPKYFTQVDTEQIILAPVPDYNVANGLVMTLVLQPSQAATGFPSWIYNQFIYSICYGAVSKLMLLNNKPWTDLVTGADKRKDFQEEIANARAGGANALGRAAVRAKSQH